MSICLTTNWMISPASIVRPVALLAALCAAQPVLALGTAAGTTVSNTVTVNYEVNNVAGSRTASNNFLVDEIIDVVLTWQDAANVVVVSPENDRVLTYLLTNTGNGDETFSLAVDNALAGNDDFDPQSPRIHLDGNGNGVFEGAATDPQYNPGTNDPQLNATSNPSQTIFVVNDIPASLVSGQTGESRLTAASTTPSAAGAAAGTVLNGAGDSGVDVVVGNTQASADSTGTYVIDMASVALIKTAEVVANGQGCNAAPCEPLPGSTIRYTIRVEITGSGNIDNLIITDPVPANTTYLPETLTLNNTSLTDDNVDADAGSFVSNQVRLDFGNVVAPRNDVITFDVTLD